jgi:hypothetical protein
LTDIRAVISPPPRTARAPQLTPNHPCNESWLGH